jgi:hypothetical protein
LTSEVDRKWGEHMVKLQVLGNNSKTINNIKNLTWGKTDQHIKIYLPCNFEVNLITHGNNSKMGNGIYFTIAGWVDLDMPHIFAI